jgi:hypothetical protein
VAYFAAVREFQFSKVLDKWSEHANHMFSRLENHVESLWDGIAERPGNREERRRKKKTKR